MIHVHDVRMSFGANHVLRGATLVVGEGEAVALCGVNGAGKSTLIQCVNGVHRFAGAITVGGFDVRTDGKRARRLLGYVPQELAFRDDMRVDEVIWFHAALRGLGRVDARNALRPVGLEEHARARSRVLSGGMKQRLALALALMGDPPVLLLDELSASLDVAGRESFLHLLVSLRGEGRTVLFASHRPEEVEILAGRVAWIEEGRIVVKPSGVRKIVSDSTVDAIAAIRKETPHGACHGACVATA